jgi:hypothetical protein
MWSNIERKRIERIERIADRTATRPKKNQLSLKAKI